MSQTATRSGLPYIVRLILGLALAVGGFWVSKNVHIGALDQLAEQGIVLDFGKTVAVVGVLIMLFPLIKTFFVDPLNAAIHSRNSELERTFSEAEDLRARMDQMRLDYERRLAETEAAAREQIQAQMRQAQETAAQLRAEAASQAEQLKRRALDEIETERQKALTDLRIYVVNMALGATEKLVGENVDTERNRKLVDEFIEKVEVTS
ncbi:MAG: F0F1 ATP synthase subunit B [Fimbriimonadaceae bacterium]